MTVDLTPYIAGGIGIVGTLLGVLCTYYFAMKLADTHASHAAHQAETNALREACAKFRAALAPALGQIYLAQKHGDYDRPSIEAFVKSNLLAHASAIEEFRPFVATHDSAAYQEAWENYRKLAHDSHLATAEDWTTELPGGSALEKRIHDILSFAKT